MNKLFKKIAAVAVVATACIGAISATASADAQKMPVNWQAIRLQGNGAPSSYNKVYTYEVYTAGNGYDISCTSINGDYDKNVEARKIYTANVLGIKTPVDELVANIHSTTNSPIVVEHPKELFGNTITFTFYANCFYSCNAGGVISAH